MIRLSLISIFMISFYSYECLPDQGVWTVDLVQSNHTAFFTKTMFANSSVYLKIICHSENPDTRVIVSWLLRYSPCPDEFVSINNDLASRYLAFPKRNFVAASQYEKMSYILHKDVKSYLCSKDSPIYLENAWKNPSIQTVYFTHKTKGNITSKNTTTKATKKKIQKRAAVPVTKAPTTIKTSTDKNVTKPPTKMKNEHHGPPARSTTHPGSTKDDLELFKVAETWSDGAYLFVVNIQMARPKATPKVHPQFSAEVTVWMKSSYGFLSAMEWPFLIFYGVMCLVYLAYAIAWTILSACHWRDILRVQFWIGAVILLGMLEKAMFYAEYQSINSTGRSVRGAVLFAEFVSCIKRTLARLLVMVVSIGYGIVKPRLGPALVKVVAIGIAYFIFALIEGCLRVLQPRFTMSTILFVVQVPLALTDAIILWWTFTYLVQTIQQMRLRRNIVKFNLYKHFSNILILVVGVSVVFMGWSVFYHKWFTCKKHWREMWVDDAFWHILFSVILLVIIWLWRPSKNNQRYAYSPVLDADDDADEDILMDNLTTGELSKKTSHAENGTTKRDASKPEDDLRWVEEHIPSSSAAENVFPLVDSDEEIATTKLQLNKME